MTTNDEQYVPSEDDVRARYVFAGLPDRATSDQIARARDREVPEFDRFLARVRRDAARDAVEDADYWQARAYEAEGKLWKAEARIKAVQDALDVDEHVTKQMGTLGQWRPDVPAIAHDTIRRALDG